MFSLLQLSSSWTKNSFFIIEQNDLTYNCNHCGSTATRGVFIIEQNDLTYNCNHCGSTATRGSLYYWTVWYCCFTFHHWGSVGTFIIEQDDFTFVNLSFSWSCSLTTSIIVTVYSESLSVNRSYSYNFHRCGGTGAMEKKWPVPYVNHTALCSGS